MATCYAFMYGGIYFGGGGGAPGFLTPVVSYAPRPIVQASYLFSGLGQKFSMASNMATYRKRKYRLLFQ